MPVQDDESDTGCRRAPHRPGCGSNWPARRAPQKRQFPWFAKLIAYGEFLIGIALIVGAFVGIAAFFGAFMNWNFIMAGSASSNGLLLITAVLLILAWKVAGYLGADRYLLPRLGVPWRPGPMFTTPRPVPTG